MSRRDRGAASLWMLAAGMVVLVVAVGVAVRTTAVMARHRAERTADLAALAAASGIGIDAGPEVMCHRAERVATANGTRLTACRIVLDPSARSGTSSIQVQMTIWLAGVGPRRVTASARAARLPG